MIAKLKQHGVVIRNSPTHKIAVCVCGWQFQTTRKQNAWASAAKVRSAVNKHLKDCE